MKTNTRSVRTVSSGYRKRGELWGDYETVAEYQGLTSLNSARNYRCRHQLRTIQHGRKKLVSKSDLDRKSGIT